MGTRGCYDPAASAVEAIDELQMELAEQRKPSRTVRSRRKPKGAGPQRRAEILAAAKELFVSDGFNRVTTRALAEKAGLSQTGLYLYFRTKEEILRAICDETHDALREAFDRAVSEGATPGDRLRALMRTYIEFGLAHPAEYQLTFTVGPEALVAARKDFSRPFDEQQPGPRNFLRLRDHLAALGANHLLGGRDPMLVAQILWFVGHGAVSLLISRPHFPWVERQQLIGSLEEVLIAGLASPSSC
jgi:AcrR family transcriptional regulator